MKKYKKPQLVEKKYSLSKKSICADSKRSAPDGGVPGGGGTIGWIVKIK